MGVNKRKIRKKFRDDVFERDEYKCRRCGEDFSDQEFPENYLDAHHITDRSEMPNGGYVKENGISLCKENFNEEGELVESCHMLAEKFHISDGKEWEKYMHPDDLYKLIGSSYELAYEKSLKL
jgi:5-methylcytosine-specific restriction endonuclease McrA